MNEIRELIVDAYGCAADLNDHRALEKAARAAVEAVGATVAEGVNYRFQPHGITLCLVLKESHLILSTWPEHGLAIVNVFLCNPAMDANRCWEILERMLKPARAVMHSVKHRIEPMKSAA